LRGGTIAPQCTTNKTHRDRSKVFFMKPAALKSFFSSTSRGQSFPLSKEVLISKVYDVCHIPYSKDIYGPRYGARFLVIYFESSRYCLDFDCGVSEYSTRLS